MWGEGEPASDEEGEVVPVLPPPQTSETLLLRSPYYLNISEHRPAQLQRLQDFPSPPHLPPTSTVFREGLGDLWIAHEGISSLRRGLADRASLPGACGCVSDLFSSLRGCLPLHFWSSTPPAPSKRLSDTRPSVLGRAVGEVACYDLSSLRTASFRTTFRTFPATIVLPVNLRQLNDLQSRYQNRREQVGLVESLFVVALVSHPPLAGLMRESEEKFGVPTEMG